MKRSYQQNYFLPDFCGVRMVFVVVLIAELLAIMITLASPVYLSDFTSDLALNSLFIQWIALTSVAILCICQPFFKTLGNNWVATLSYFLVLLVTFIVTEITWWLMNQWPEITGSPSLSHYAFLLRCMGISSIVSALALRYLYVQFQWRHNIESEISSRIQALQSRIRPHFLFNCMNTIASLTRKNPGLAEEAIEDLADLFRVSIKDAKKLSTLNEELTLCRRYLRIETHRLGKRLHINWDVDELPGNALLPALTLQPLLENAIYHGIENLPDGGTININGEYKGNKIIINIDNPLQPSTHSDVHEGNKLAQENVEQRISACFGGKGGLHTTIINNRYRAQVVVPYQYEDTNR